MEPEKIRQETARMLKEMVSIFARTRRKRRAGILGSGVLTIARM